MARQSPYLQRRGDTFGFRIAVPQALRPVIRYREICKCLHTSDKRIALPRALALAAKTKLLFHELPIQQYVLNFRTALRVGDALHLAIAKNHGAVKLPTLDDGLLKAAKLLAVPAHVASASLAMSALSPNTRLSGGGAMCRQEAAPLWIRLRAKRRTCCPDDDIERAASGQDAARAP
jgi:hypothetical protein